MPRRTIKRSSMTKFSMVTLVGSRHILEKEQGQREKQCERAEFVGKVIAM